MQEQAALQDLVYALSAAPDGSFYLAARQSGLARSDDGGINWHPLIVLPEHDAQPSISALALARADDALHVFAGVTGGVFVSRDGGTSWTPTPIAAPPPFITVLVASPNYASDGIAFAASMEDGVFRTDDFGASWRPWGFGLFDFHVLGLAVSTQFADDSTVYALTESGIYRSGNTGRSWQLTGFPLDAAPILCMAIAPDGTLYAGTEESGLYRSADRGATWERLALETDDSINAILLGAGEMLVLTGGGAWRSTDDCASWSPIHTDVDFGDGLTAALAPRGLGAGKPLLLGFADGRILTVAQSSHD